MQDLEAELLITWCYDVEVEAPLQPVTGEDLNRGANQASDARLDIRARGFWERQRSAYFDARVCHPNADSYKDLIPEQLYRQQEQKKKGKYATRVLEVEQGTFTPLVFSTTGGRRLHQIPIQTSRAPCHKELRDLQYHCFMDSSQAFFYITGWRGGHFYT